MTSSAETIDGDSPRAVLGAAKSRTSPRIIRITDICIDHILLIILLNPFYIALINPNIWIPDISALKADDLKWNWLGDLIAKAAPALAFADLFYPQSIPHSSKAYMPIRYKFFGVSYL